MCARTSCDMCLGQSTLNLHCSATRIAIFSPLTVCRCDTDWHGNPALCSTLVRMGACPTARNTEGLTPLGQALVSGSGVETVRALAEPMTRSNPCLW